MLLPPKLRPMRTCLKASWPPSSQSGTKKRSRDTSSANEKPWKAAGGLLTLVHRGRVMLVLTVNRLHYLWPTWQLSPMKAWVRKSQMNPISAIVRGTKHVFGGKLRETKTQEQLIGRKLKRDKTRRTDSTLRRKSGRRLSWHSNRAASGLPLVTGRKLGIKLWIKSHNTP